MNPLVWGMKVFSVSINYLCLLLRPSVIVNDTVSLIKTNIMYSCPLNTNCHVDKEPSNKTKSRNYAIVQAGVAMQYVPQNFILNNKHIRDKHE